MATIRSILGQTPLMQQNNVNDNVIGTKTINNSMQNRGTKSWTTTRFGTPHPHHVPQQSQQQLRSIENSSTSVGFYPVTILDSYHSHIYYARLRVRPAGLSLVIQSPLPSSMINNGQYAALNDSTYLTQINLSEIILFKFDRPSVKIFLHSIFHSYTILLSSTDYNSFRADCKQHYKLRLVDPQTLSGGAQIGRVLGLQQTCFLLNREFPHYYEMIVPPGKTSTNKTSSNANFSRNSSLNLNDSTAQPALQRLELDLEWDYQTNLTRLMHGLSRRKNNRVRTWPDQVVIDEYWRERTASAASAVNVSADSHYKAMLRDVNNSWRALIQSVYLSEATLAYINED